VFRTQVFYSHPSLGKWSNVYHVSAADLLTARDAFVGNVEPDLLDILNTACTLIGLLVSALDSDEFSELTLNDAGNDTGSGTLLPLFNSVKVSIQPANLGRPDVKFIKGYLTEDTHSTGMVSGGALSAVEAKFVSFITAMDTNTTPLVSEDGSEWVAASAQPEVQMRQMHRRRRRS